MTVQFIRNEAPGYCVLITFYQFIKAMHMSYNEFVNTFPGTPPKELFDKRMPGWWDGIHSGRMKYPELKRVFFRPDGEGVEMYDICDPFLEGIFKIQSGLDIHQVINKTKNFDKDIKNYWDDNKMEAWYDAYRDRCQEVPFVCCWLNFMHKKFTWPKQQQTTCLTHSCSVQHTDILRKTNYHSTTTSNQEVQIWKQPKKLD